MESDLEMAGSDLDQDINYDVLDRVGPMIVNFGKRYNGFECFGLENLPLDRPALLVFYHAFMPLDAWYFGMNFYLEKKLLIRPLADSFLFRTPGLGKFCRSVGGVPGSPETALQLLREGNLVGVSPGGVREAIKGRKNSYQLMWGDRRGFARVACEAKVDVIPIFTENVDELYRTPFSDHRIFQKLYEKTRLPLVPFVGLGALPFPVKLRSWVGKAIPCDTNDVEEMRAKSKKALEDLIQRHQKEPSLWSALKDRLF